MLTQKLRLRRGWSQQQLAEMCGISTRTVQRIERGQPASPESLKALAAVFDLDYSQLTPEPAMSTALGADLNVHTESEEALAFAHVRKLKGFYIHAIEYAVVTVLLLVLNLCISPHVWWVAWPAAVWGVALVLHGLTIFTHLPWFDAAWEKRQVERRLGRSL